MSWAETLPALAVAVLVVFGPGLVWGAALGLRRLTLLALAGPFSVTAVVISAEVAAFAGIDWSLPPVLAVTVVVGLGLWLLRRTCGHLIHRASSDAEPPGAWRTVLTAWAVAAIPVAAIMVWMFGVPENIAQSHDNIFHLNALRYIDETANSSSLTLGYLGSREGTFYPAGWHAVVSLVIATAGIPLTAAINVTNLVLICGIWSLGCLFLVSRLAGERAVPLLVAAVVSTAYSSFPYLLLEFGVVYPFMLSIAILPAALGLVIQLVGAGTSLPFRRFGTVLLLVGLLPGLMLSHPSTLLGLLALSAPAILAVTVTAVRHSTGRRRLATATGGVVFVLLGAVLWMTVRPGPGASDNWARMGDAGGAVWEVLFHGPLGRPVGLLATVLTAVGAAVVLYLRSHRWVIGTYLVAGALFVIGSWQEAPALRLIVAGPWYNDYFRISAMLAPAGILVASIGGIAVVGSVLSALRTVRERRLSHRSTGSVWLLPAAGALLVISGLIVAQLFAVQRAVTEAAFHYRYSEDSRLLSSAELALLERLPETVPADALVVGDPLTGASLSYAFAGREALMPAGTNPATPDARLIFDELDTMLDNPEVCAAVLNTNTGFVLDFGQASVHGGTAEVFPGLRSLTSENGFELVDQEGAAKLYRIVGCA